MRGAAKHVDYRGVAPDDEVSSPQVGPGCEGLPVERVAGSCVDLAKLGEHPAWERGAQTGNSAWTAEWLGNATDVQQRGRASRREPSHREPSSRRRSAQMKLSQTAMLRTKRAKGWLCEVLR